MTETAAVRARGWRSRRVRLFLLLATLALLVGYVGLDLWAGHRVNVTVAELEKRYGRIDEGSLQLKPVPASDNRARVVRAAAALIVFMPGTASSDVSMALSRLHLSVQSKPLPTDLKDFVEINRRAIRVADDARSRRESNWEVDRRNGQDSLPYLDIRMLSNAIYLAALMDVEAGRPEDAAKTSANGLAVTGSLRQEPSLLAQLVRISMGFQQMEAIHGLVSQYEPSKASLEELAKWLSEDQMPDPGQMGLLGELKHINANWLRMERGDLSSVGSETPFWLGSLARLGRPFIRLTRAQALRQIGGRLDVQTGPRPRPARPAAPAPTRWARLVNLSFPGFDRAIETCDQFNSALGATQLAVALRRFKIDHGTYPDALSALVPAYVASVPIDPFTGQPPVYSREGAGFQLRAQGGTNVSRQIASALSWNVPK